MKVSDYVYAYTDMISEHTIRQNKQELADWTESITAYNIMKK